MLQIKKWTNAKTHQNQEWDQFQCSLILQCHARKTHGHVENQLKKKSATERRACIIPKLRLHIVLDKGSCNFQNKHDRSLLHYHVSWAHGLSACRAFAIHLLHNVVDTEETNLVDQSLPSAQTDFHKKKLKNGGRFQWPGSCRDRQKMICPSHPGSACKVDMIHPGNALWFSGVPICFWTQDTTVLIVLIAHNPVARNQRS